MRCLHLLARSCALAALPLVAATGWTAAAADQTIPASSVVGPLPTWAPLPLPTASGPTVGVPTPSVPGLPLPTPPPLPGVSLPLPSVSLPLPSLPLPSLPPSVTHSPSPSSSQGGPTSPPPTTSSPDGVQEPQAGAGGSGTPGPIAGGVGDSRRPRSGSGASAGPVGAVPGGRPDGPGRRVAQALRERGATDLTLLLAVLATAAGFLLAQHWVDRRDPKLAAMADRGATELEFTALPDIRGSS